MNEQPNHQQDSDGKNHERSHGTGDVRKWLFLGSIGLDRYAISGILAITLGTVFMTGLTQSPRLLILGAVINGIGLFVMAVGSFRSGKRDRLEVIDRIDGFREELMGVKHALNTGDPLGKVEEIENEFNGWAEDFLTGMEGKIIQHRKSDVLLKEAEINLSRRWRHLYEYTFDTICQMLTAYNEKANGSIEFTIPPVPFNLFGEGAQSFGGVIEFDVTAAWRIKLSITRPHTEERVPGIVITFCIGESSGESAVTRARKDGCGEWLLLSVDPQQERIRVYTSSQNLYVGDIKTEYSINDNDYRTSVKQLVTTLVEHQIVRLCAE